MRRRGRYEDLAIFIRDIVEVPHYNRQYGEGGSSKKMGASVPEENITKLQKGNVHSWKT